MSTTFEERPQAQALRAVKAELNYLQAGAFSFTYNPAHRWYYFPKLRPDEALLLKIYDSREDGTARLTAHTAFEDPTTSENAAPRKSIELRALVFWKD